MDVSRVPKLIRQVFETCGCKVSQPPGKRGGNQGKRFKVKKQKMKAMTKCTGTISDVDTDIDDGWGANDEIVARNKRSALGFRVDDKQKTSALFQDNARKVSDFSQIKLHIDAGFKYLANYSIVHLASYFGALQCLKWALSEGGSTKKLNDYGRDPFWYANINKTMEDAVQKELGLTYLSRVPGVADEVNEKVLEVPFKTLSMKCPSSSVYSCSPISPSI